MFKYILQRIGFAILTLIIIIIVVYLMTAQFSDNPFANRMMSQGNGGSTSMTEAQKKFLFEESVKYHFTPSGLIYEEVKNTWTSIKVSPFIRLGYWFKDLFDPIHPFGVVYSPGVLDKETPTIPGYFFKYLKFTIIITLPAFIFSAILGIILGIVAGYKRGSTFDTVINAFSLLFIALPSFVIAPILISILLKFGVPPVFYNYTDAKVIQTQGWGKVIVSWLPPIFILVLSSLSGYITYTRNQVITVLTSNYVLIAKSKGLNTREIFIKYVLRNISIPLAAILIPSYIGLLTGGVVIERYWSVPGTSQVFVNAFSTGEINLIMFSTTFFTTLSLFTSILVDIVYALIDPRIKYGTKSQRSLSTHFKAYLNRKKQFKEYEQQANTAIGGQ